MTTLKFIAWWASDNSAGLRAGSEELTIQFKHGVPVTEDTVEYWRDQVSQFFDGAVVEGGVVR